jgi:hypothetical protein
MVEWDNNPVVIYFIKKKNKFDNKNDNLWNFWLDIMSISLDVVLFTLLAN